MAVLNFIQQVLSTPAIFVGLLALLGLALQKKDAQTMIKGTIKTILGFIVLNAGASRCTAGDHSIWRSVPACIRSTRRCAEQ